MALPKRRGVAQTIKKPPRKPQNYSETETESENEHSSSDNDLFASDSRVDVGPVSRRGGNNHVKSVKRSQLEPKRKQEHVHDDVRMRDASNDQASASEDNVEQPSRRPGLGLAAVRSDTPPRPPPSKAPHLPTAAEQSSRRRADTPKSSTPSLPVIQKPRRNETTNIFTPALSAPSHPENKQPSKPPGRLSHLVPKGTTNKRKRAPKKKVTKATSASFAQVAVNLQSDPVSEPAPASAVDTNQASIPDYYDSADEMSNFIPPNQQRHMRACMVCSIVRTQSQFVQSGCPNCEHFMELTGSLDAVQESTSQVFEGLITVSDTGKSWVARFQRLEGYVPGVYAVQVEGILPEDIVAAAENAGVNYIPRDGSVSEALPNEN